MDCLPADVSAYMMTRAFEEAGVETDSVHLSVETLKGGVSGGIKRGLWVIIIIIWIGTLESAVSHLCNELVDIK